MKMNKGKIIIISGPSGVGKGTICKKLLENQKFNLVTSISMTTRKKRNNEIDGINYFFVSENEFKKNIEDKMLLEYAKFVGNYYGTPKKYCDEQLLKGKNILLEIEVLGAMQVMKNAKNIISIFILPPSIEELMNRIVNRNTESVENINKRIQQAQKEIECSSKYNYRVINDKLNDAIDIIENILNRELKNE